MRVMIERWTCHGDVLVATSVLPGVRAKYPDAHIIFAAQYGYETLLFQSPYINEIVFAPPRVPPDIHLIMDHERFWSDVIAKKTSMAHAHCICAGVDFHPPQLFLTDEERNWAAQYSGRVVVAGKCGWNSRRYIHLEETVKLLQEQGVPLIQVDMGPDLGCESVKCSLREAAAIVASSQLYLGVDTVFMHMAVAFGIPMVLAMGATGIECQYIPNATVVRQYPWTSTGDHRYPEGIDVPSEVMVRAFMTRYNTTNLIQMAEVSYTNGAGNEIIAW